MIGVEEAKDAARTLKKFCEEQKGCSDCYFGVKERIGKFKITHCGICYPGNQDWEGNDDEEDR